MMNLPIIRLRRVVSSPVLTGVKRLAGDNTAVSGTPSLDNYITLVLHCFHSLLVILLKSW